MARPPRLDVPDAFYHVIARGNQRRSVFRDDTDFRRYIELLTYYQQRHRFTLYAYVLMPNHVHLLISPHHIRLAKSMQGLQQSYTQSFNKRHRLVGHCFQGRYKAILCDVDAYLLELLRYVHLNPVRAGLADTPEGYPWSSHSLYLIGHDSGGVAVEDILRQFSSARDHAVVAYRAFVRDGLPEGHRQDLYTVVSQRLLGDDRFVERMEKQAPRHPQKFPVKLHLDTLAPQIGRILGVSEVHLHDEGRSRAAALARAIIAYIAREEGAIPLTASAYHFKRDPATLSLALQRLEARMGQDPALVAKIDHLRRIIRRGAARKMDKQISKA